MKIDFALFNIKILVTSAIISASAYVYLTPEETPVAETQEQAINTSRVKRSTASQVSSHKQERRPVGNHSAKNDRATEGTDQEDAADNLPSESPVNNDSKNVSTGYAGKNATSLANNLIPIDESGRFVNSPANWSPSGIVENPSLPKQDALNENAPDTPYFTPPKPLASTNVAPKKVITETNSITGSTFANNQNQELPAAPTSLVRLTPSMTPGTDTLAVITVSGGDVASGSIVTLYSDNLCANAISDPTTSTGTSVDVTTSTLNAGAYTFYATVTKNSLTSACSSNVAAANYFLDLTPPGVPAIAFGPSTTSTGKDSRAVFTISLENGGAFETTDTITLHAQAACAGSSVGSITNVTATSTPITADAQNDGSTITYSVKVTDEAGNTSCSSSHATPTSRSKTYLYDGTPPNAPAIAFNSPANSPSNDPTPTFDITLTASAYFDSTDTIYLYAQAGCAGASVADLTNVTSRTATITASAQAADTTLTYSAKVTDHVGNETCSSAHLSPGSQSKTYTYDSSASPTPVINMASGSSNPSTDSTPSFTISLSGDVNFTNGDVVVLYEGGDNACNGVARGSATISGSSTTSVDITTNSAIATISTVNYFAKVTKTTMASSCLPTGYAYSLGPSAPTSLTLVTPSTPGTNSSPTIRVGGGGVINGSSVILYSNNTCTNAVSSLWTSTGTSVDITTSTLNAGPHTFYARVTVNSIASDCSDIANATNYFLDLTPPGVPAIAFDSPGSSPNNDPTPSFVVSLEGSGTFETTDTITLHGQAACAGAFLDSVSGISTGTTILTASGQTNGTTLTYSVKVTDEAGNISCSSSHSNAASRSKVYAYDGTPPSAPSIALEPPATSPGNDSTPTFLVALTSGNYLSSDVINLYSQANCAGTSVATKTNVSSTHSTSIEAAPQAAGSLTYSVKVTDAAGNSTCSSSHASAQSAIYVYDNTPPSAPAISFFSPATSLGNISTPTFTVTLTSGNFLSTDTTTLYPQANCSGTSVGTRTGASGSGTTTVTASAQAEGSLTYSVKVTDNAGNSTCSSSHSTGQSVAYNYDGTPPATPILTLSSPSQSPGGDSTPTMTVTLTGGGLFSASDTINIYNAEDCTGSVVGTATNVTTSSKSIEVSTAQSIGITKYSAKVTDAAGNSSCIGDPYASYTKVFLKMNGSNGSTTFTDEASHIFTASGDAQISTAQHITNGASALFDGTLDFISSPDSADYDLTATFTVEAWIRLNSLPARIKAIAGNEHVGYDWSGWNFTVNDTNKLSFYAASSKIVVTSSSTLSTNQWYHVAASGDGSTIRLFIDGTQVGSVASTASNADAYGNALRVGSLKVYNDGADFSFPGYIDNFRLTKGLARYTSSFTPSASFYTPYEYLIPDPPTSLTRVSPGLTPGNDVNPIINVSGGSVASGSKVILYSDSSCSTPVSVSTTSTGNNVNVQTNTLTNGAYSFYATVTIGAAVSACSDVSNAANYLLDTISPITATSLSLKTPPTSPNNDTTPEVTLSGGDSGQLGVTAKIYSNNTCTTLAGTGSISSADVTADTLGSDTTYTFWSKLFDEAGNASACSSASVSYTLDTTGPTVTIGSPSVAALKNGSTVAFTATYSGVGSGSVTLSSGGVTLNTVAGNASCSGILVTSPTSTTRTITLSNCTGDGALTVTVNANTATDTYGNTSTASSASSSVTIDNTAPTITGLSNDPTPTASKTWTWGCNETCTYRYAVDSSSTWTATGSYSSTITAGKSDAIGTYYLHVEAQDAAGNTSAVTSVSAFLIAPLDVTARYTGAYAQVSGVDRTYWMDHIKFSSIGTPTSTVACDGSESLRTDCVHAAEYKKVDISQLSDCSGLSMTDTEGWFDWTCTDNGSTITFYGQMKSTKSARNLIDFNNDVTPSFKSNSVILAGCGSSCPLTSAATKWWNNPVAVLPDNAGASPIRLDGANGGGNDFVMEEGTILTLANSRNTAGFEIYRNKIGIVLASSATLTFTGTSVLDSSRCNLKAIICISGSSLNSYFSYIEGTFVNGSGANGTYGLYISLNSHFNRFGNLSVSGFITNGISTSTAKRLTFTNTTVTNTTGVGFYSGNGSTDNDFGNVTVTGSTNSTSDHGMHIIAGNHTLNNITVNDNSGAGIYFQGSVSSVFTVTGNISASRNNHGVYSTSGSLIVNGAISTSNNNSKGVYSTASSLQIGSITANQDTIDGVYLDGATSGNVGNITVTGDTGASLTNTGYGAVLLTTGVTYGNINISEVGNAAADYSLYIEGGNTIASANVYNNAGTGIALRAAHNMNIGPVNVHHNGDNGLTVGYGLATNDATFGTITSSHNAGYGIEVALGSSGNKFPKIIAGNNGYNGLYLTNGKNNVFKEVYTFNNSKTTGTNGGGIYLAAASGYNSFGQVVATNNMNSGIHNIGLYNTFTNVTVANNLQYGLISQAVTAKTAIYHNLLVMNNGTNASTYAGIIKTGTAPTTFSNVAVLNNTAPGIYLNSSSADAKFTGLLMVGNNALDCKIGTTTTRPGLIATTCSDSEGSSTYTGQASDALLRRNSTTQYSGVSSVIGKVSSDSVNTTDSSGTATYASTLDFINFENHFRTWGKDGSAFANSNSISTCTTSGTCRIWDWSLSRDDTTLLNRSGNGANINNGFSTGTNGVTSEILGDGVGDDDGVCEASELCKNSFAINSTCPVQVSETRYLTSAIYTYDSLYEGGKNGFKVVDGSGGTCDAGEACVDATPAASCTTSGDVCVQRYLSNASEILLDGKGDDDGLCEKNEDCFYTPNIGAYQGHGDLIGVCNYDVGSGINVYGFEFNGL